MHMRGKSKKGLERGSSWCILRRAREGRWGKGARKPHSITQGCIHLIDIFVFLEFIFKIASFSLQFFLEMYLCALKHKNRVVLDTHIREIHTLLN